METKNLTLSLPKRIFICIGYSHFKNRVNLNIKEVGRELNRPCSRVLLYSILTFIIENLFLNL